MKKLLLEIISDYGINPKIREKAIGEYIKISTPPITEQEYKNMSVYDNCKINKNHKRLKNTVIKQNQIVFSINKINDIITLHKWLIKG